MRKARVFLLVGIVCLMPACSREAVKRTGYETLQNIKEQQCEKDLSSECPERESYDAYQKEKKALESPPEVT